MTIAIDGRALQGAYGGIDVYTHQLVMHMLQEGTQHRFILFFNGSRSFRHRFGAGNAMLKIVQTHMPSKLFNGAILACSMPKLDQYIQRAAGESIDLFFMPNMNFASFSNQARVVVTVHDASYIHYAHRQSIKGKIWHASVKPKKLLSRAQGIIVVSESCRDDIMKVFGIDGSSIAVIPLGIEKEFFLQTRSNKLPFILAFCPQEPRKNIETLIDAYALARMRNEEIRKSLLVLAGAHGMPATIRSAISRNQLQNNVKIINYLPYERRYRLLASSRLCVYASIYEGFGLPPLEACAANVPVIAGAHSSIPRVSGDAVWYCDPYDIDSLSRSLIVMYTNEAIRSQMMCKGKDLSGRYDWNVTARKTLDFFNTICGLA